MKLQKSNVKATPVQRVCNPHSALSGITGPKSLREWAMISQRQLGAVLAAFGYRHCDKTTIAHYERGRRVPEIARRAYGSALAWRVELESDGLFSATLTKRWVVNVKRKCRDCGRMFRPERVDIVRCGRCRKFRILYVGRLVSAAKE